MYNAMLHANRATARTCRPCDLHVGGAAIPVELIRAFEEKFDCIILEGYGLSGDLAGRLVQPPGQGA